MFAFELNFLKWLESLRTDCGHTQGFATWSSFFAAKFKKIWISILVGMLITAVAVSRLYLGAHYPSDVIVGVALGVGISLFGNYLFAKVKDVIFEIMQISLLIDAVRYFIVVMTVGYLCPMLFKKIKL